METPHRALFVVIVANCLCYCIWQAKGQLDVDGLPESVNATPSAFPALEHRSHAGHPQGNASAPGPAPEAHAGAPALEALPGARTIEGVAHVGAPAAGPESLQQGSWAGGTLHQLPRTLANPPAQKSTLAPAAAPAAAPGSQEMKATEVFTPPVPSAFVSADGTLVLMGPSAPSVGLTPTGATADHLLWWMVAVIALVGVMCSIAWAYSRNRSRRYMDLKEADSRMTEMASQQQHDTRV